MPLLERIALPKLNGADRLVDKLNSLALTASGSITFQPEWLASRKRQLFVSVDSIGQVIGRWGRFGEGPGEVRGGYVMLPSDSLVVVAGVGGAPVMLFTSSGKLVRQKDGLISAVPYGMTDRRFIWWRSNSRGPGPTYPFRRGDQPQVISWCIFRKCQDRILKGSDSVLAIIDSAVARKGTSSLAPIAFDSWHIWIADPYSYTIWRWNASGDGPAVRFGRRILPRMPTARRIRDEEEYFATMERKGTPGPDGRLVRNSAKPYRDWLLKMPMPHFGWQGMWADGRDRLWVIGGINDSTFVDIFSDTTFVGRQMLGCAMNSPTNGRGVVRGHWLALQCQTDSEEYPYEIRLYRIVEPADSTALTDKSEAAP